MDRMDVSNEVRTFGTGGLGASVELPYVWNSGERAAFRSFHFVHLLHS